MRLIRVINNGGFGRVEEVELPSTKRAARKVFDPEPFFVAAAGVTKLKERFKREVKVQSALDPKFCMPVLDVGLAAEPPWFTMPLADRSLRDEINDARAANTIPKKALADVLNALEAIHELGYVHRDLKPENVLLHASRWKLSDFGLVRPPAGQTTVLTSTDSAWGTAPYAAPEQCSDFRNVGPAADIFAFGCMLHDIVSGAQRVPYAQQTAAGPVGRIIEKCTEVNPAKRFASIRTLRGALLSVLSTQNIAPRPDVDEWGTKLQAIDAWDTATAEEFARFLKQHDDLALPPCDLRAGTIEAIYAGRFAAIGWVDFWAVGSRPGLRGGHEMQPCPQAARPPLREPNRQSCRDEDRTWTIVHREGFGPLDRLLKRGRIYERLGLPGDASLPVLPEEGYSVQPIHRRVHREPGLQPEQRSRLCGKARVQRNIRDDARDEIGERRDR
jgi:hypothetical protein